MRNRVTFTTLFLASLVAWGSLASTALGTPASQCLVQELTVGELSVGELSKDARVSAPVPGLYHSIPTEHEVVAGPIKFQLQYGNFVNVTKNGTLVGQFARGYQAKTKTFYFDGSALKGAPSFVDVPGVVPLVQGRGVPTQAFASLMLMKSFGVKYGELAHAETNAVNNLKTTLQMIRSPAYKNWLKERPTPYPTREVLEEALQGSHTVSYMETVLKQSGHKITKVRINDAEIQWTPLSQMLFEHQNEADASVQALLFDRDANGNLTKLSVDQLVPSHFAVEMDLAPFAR